MRRLVVLTSIAATLTLLIGLHLLRSFVTATAMYLYDAAGVPAPVAALCVRFLIPESPVRGSGRIDLGGALLLDRLDSKLRYPTEVTDDIAETLGLRTASIKLLLFRARRKLAEARVYAQPCPLFVPLVEEGWTDHPVTRQIAREYLQPLAEAEINTLVLGCTHYPLLKSLLCRELGAGVHLIDSAAETAAEIGRVLRDRDMLASGDAPPKHRFIASDDPLQFLQLGQRFLGDTIESVEVHTFV